MQYLNIPSFDDVNMISTAYTFANDDTIRAAPDADLSSSETHLLATLLAQEDQHDYQQIITLQLPETILHALLQISPLLHPHSSATLWMTITLLKKLILQQHHSIDLTTVVASLTLSHKYLHSQIHTIDYDRIAHCCDIDDSHFIHDAEVALLDALSYDVSACTPDDVFSYLTNCADDDHAAQQLIEQARCSLSHHQTPFGLLHSYPSSVVALSLMFTLSSASTFVGEQMKAFLVHKKDPQHYLTQLLHCIAQLQSYAS